MAFAASVSPASASSNSFESSPPSPTSFDSPSPSPNSLLYRPPPPSSPTPRNSLTPRPLSPNSPLPCILLPPNSPLLNKKLPQLPSFDLPSFDSLVDFDTRLSLSDPSSSLKLDSPPVIAASTPTPTASATATPPAPNRFRLGVTRSKSYQRPKSWLSSLKKDEDVKVAQRLEPPTKNGTMARSSLSERSQSATDSLASFARRSWITRTPSPKVMAPPENTSETTPKASKSLPHLHTGVVSALGRTASYFSRSRSRSSILTTQQDCGADSDSCTSSSASQTAPHSLTSRTSQSTSSDSNLTPITDDTCNGQTRQVRDSLWSSFKTLELEFHSFTLKSTTQRIAQIQNVLLPFLRSTMHHASTKKVQPEDIDHRAVIFSRWWNAILDMLDLQANQPIPGVDRPILLETAIMLMMRPEWRQTTTYYQALTDRSPKEKVGSPLWTSEPNPSMMLAETAEHSVRTMFVTNLIRQMSLVVEKMSLRHAPLTLVNFAGKTCAYAFFFAPGIADVLLRLWGLGQDVIRRTAEGFGLPRCDNGDSEDIVAFFPPRLGLYGWSSPRAAWNQLRQAPRMPVSVTRIPWNGPWVSRWRGRDTDLFFIFCKYFHILTDQFLLPGLPLELRARAPAYVLVQAQLLSVIDSTIHRHAELGSIYHPPPVDSLRGADVSAVAIAVPPSNLMKNMSENRLVALLKDFLTDDYPEFARAKATFAETFAALLKAGALKTSKFDNSACFTLCDFLEEIFVVYDKYETEQHVTSHIDWTFWFEVLKRVMSSMNTMSEVRTLSFLYKVWNIATRQSSRKAELCLDWLLAEDAFNLFFNNWCPMVRAYYQRLLCWRICRFDGSLSDLDMTVFHLAMHRLKTVWSHYLYLKDSAQEAGRTRPSSAAMSPAVGKRFIIIRQEVHTPHPGLIMGLDTFARAPSGSDLAAMGDYVDSQLLSKGDTKRRWSIFGKVLSFTNMTLAETSNRLSDEAGLGQDEAGEARRPCTRSSIHSQKKFQLGGSSPDSVSRSSSPLLDEPGYTFKFVLAWQQNDGPSRDRVLGTPQLPGPAQDRIAGPLLPDGALEDEMGKMSNSSQLCLVEGAKNATAMSSPWEKGMQSVLVMPRVDNESSSNSTSRVASPSEESDATTTVAPNSDCQLGVTAVVATKPAGVFLGNAVYSGQALAEWMQVVNECNSFVDRRTDEGVDRLCDMEVPSLSVEGFRKL